MITNMSQLSKDLRALEKEMSDIAGKLIRGKEHDQALRNGAEILVNGMKSRVRVADKIVKRYKNGRVVATYHPGNLKRAIQILDLKDKSSAYAGVKIQRRGKGTSSGDNVDGWYGIFVEYGQRKRPFIRPTVMADGPKAIYQLKQYVESIIKKANGGN